MEKFTKSLSLKYNREYQPQIQQRISASEDHREYQLQKITENISFRGSQRISASFCRKHQSYLSFDYQLKRLKIISAIKDLREY